MTPCDFTQFSYYEPGEQGILIGNPLYTDYEDIYYQYYYKNNTSTRRPTGKMPLHIKQMIYLDYYNYIRYSGLGDVNMGDAEVGSMRHVLTSPRVSSFIRSVLFLILAPGFIILFIRYINCRWTVNGRPVFKFFVDNTRLMILNYGARIRFMEDNGVITTAVVVAFIYVLVDHSILFQ
jgi:hypothetical protein